MMEKIYLTTKKWCRIPIGVWLQAWLTLLLLCWSAGATADDNRGDVYFEAKNTKVDINGSMAYKFYFYWFNYDGNNYYWDEMNTHVVIKDEDGTEKLRIKVSDVIPQKKYDKHDFYFGVNDEDRVKKFFEEFHGKHIVTKQYSIKGVTNVYITFADPFENSSLRDKGYFMTCYICFERNYVNKKWKISWEGSWHLNSGKSRYKDVEIMTTELPVVTMPTINANSFSRSNKKINFTYPNITSYTGWSSQSILYKENSSNKWVSGNGYGKFTSTESFGVTDNSASVTFYPRFEFYKDVVPAEFGSTKYSVRFDADYGKFTIPGLPKPVVNQSTSNNMYSKDITLAWTRSSVDGSPTNGTWLIFRQAENESAPLKVGEKNNTKGATKYSFTDTSHDQEYNVNYTYTVVYKPYGWTVTSPSDAVGLTGSVKTQLTQSFSFSKMATELKNGNTIVFSWKHNQIEDASQKKSYTLEVLRSDDNQSSWKILKELKITDSKLETGSYEDKDVVAHKLYYYRLRIYVQDITKLSDPVGYTITTGSTLSGFSASRGNYTNTVKLNWTVNQVGIDPTYFVLQRRLLSSTDDNAWVDIYTTSGTSSSYSYDDQTAQPGSFNEYRLQIYDIYEGKRYMGTPLTTDGFSQSTGVVSGRISYGSGTSVEGVKVTLRPSNTDGDIVKNNCALHFQSSGCGAYRSIDSLTMRRIFGKDFTIQCYLKPDSLRMSANGQDYIVFDVQNLVTIRLYYDSAKDAYRLGFYINQKTIKSDAYIPAGEWSHITLTHNHATKTTKFWLIADGVAHDYNVSTTDELYWGVLGKRALSIANSSTLSYSRPYQGGVDEFRVFSRELSKKDIERNYDHTLAGTEEGLKIYYPMNEGLTSQTILYDFSKTDGESNGYHATMQIAALSSNEDTPNEDQLSMKTYTDQNGNYSIQGINFSGEGTNYVLTPTLGEHEFSPGNQSRFFSLNSLVHSGVDFEDVSSFTVKGNVYFENTSIPVEGAYLYVDGTMASRDGEAVKTNSDGEYTIDVPIGKHFIEVRKNGHTFVNRGRFPADPDSVGNLFTFTEDRFNLTFYDNTVVKVAGRVAGGNVEYKKPLGLGVGHNNIGKAVITLAQESEKGYLNVAEQDPNSTVISYSESSEQRDFDVVNNCGKAYVPGGTNYIEVVTDSVTGEFVALLPPLRYIITSVNVLKNTGISSSDFNLSVIDVTNPLVSYTDSLVMDDGDVSKFTYHGSAKLNYTTTPTFNVIERPDGSFGIKEYTVTDINKNEHTVKMYTKNDEDNSITYNYGYPVYEELGSYSYLLEGYEEYTNYDAKTSGVVDRVPLSGYKVIIKNQFASSTSVMVNGECYEVKDDSLSLDKQGQAHYFFNAGLPNIVEPYTRSLTITYGPDVDNMISWRPADNPFEAIVLGSLSTGKNFVTQGPDEVFMVLRDPPGSNSSMTWNKGKTVTVSKSCNVEPHSDTSIKTVAHLGVEVSIVSGLAVSKLDVTGATNDLGAGVNAHVAFSNNQGTTTTITTNREISTSNSMDYVGADADVFVGSSKNIIFGACNTVGFKYDEVNGKVILALDEALATGEQFTTAFTYTQGYIRETLIPNFIALRNNLLDTVANIKSDMSVSKPTYLTTLKINDPRFGSDNDNKDIWGGKAVSFADCKNGRYEGPSYTMILPEKLEGNGYQDMIKFYNQQIKKWENELRKNEEDKVTVISDRDTYLKENHSFDAGTSITLSTQIDTTHTRVNVETEEINAVITEKVGALYNKTGIEVEYEQTTGITVSEEQLRDTTDTETFTYTLADDGDDDYMTVDVLESCMGFGPVFYTRGGATCCPFQDEEVTRYFAPGSVINEKTIQVEKPHIRALSQSVTGIPAGGEGVFTVYIQNDSEAKADRWYNLNVVDGSNKDGLIVSMDGVNINKGRSILVPAGGTMVKTFTVKQSNPDVLTYKDVKLRISSQCQPDNSLNNPEIADTTSVSFYFQPSCSDIKLEASRKLVNVDTKEPLVLSISGYNYSMSSLQGIRLQYKTDSDADFITLQEYKKNPDGNANVLQLNALQGTEKLNYQIDLRESKFADKSYTFRAITICDIGGVEVYNESDEITVVRDLTRPELIATPTPSSGILSSGDDLTITFNEDIQNGILRKADNFVVAGVLNETEVAHDVALSLTGNNTAKTDATINLAGKSFAASMWVNYQTDGTLLQHGTSDNNFTVAIENGKLAVSVAGQKSVSSVALPAAGDWFYLNVSYDAQTNAISAGYAEGENTVSLLNNVETAAYNGNGPVALGGNNLTAKVQELAIWNDARSMAEAQADMHTTKSQYTNGLMGYWQLNEGHGATATDKARSRNLTLASENAWWINGENFALNLDGERAAAINIASLNTTNTEDYLIEAWFKADEKQNGVASVLGTQAMDLRLNTNGQMELALNDQTSTVVATNLRDGQWHHVAVNVMKSTNGFAVIYLDGQQCKQLAASAMPALYGSMLMLGGHRVSIDGQGLYDYDQMLKGAIDEVRIWKARRTSDVIKNNMYNRMDTTEAGLVAYYPMERLTLDQYNQVETNSYQADLKNKNLLISFFPDNKPATSLSMSNGNTAPLKVAPKKTNVEFSYVASERQITVTLTEQPYRIEGCNIYITAKNVKDVNGNKAQPITWGVYVQQNNLIWKDNDLVVTKSGSNEQNFTATIENRGAESESWVLSGMPSWITASEENGTLAPLATANITFTVDPSLPIGTYETTVYLTGSKGIDAPLNITVSSEGEAPDWAVTPGENTMNVIGLLKIDNVISSDTKDLVAAFNGTECVGVASPKYLSRFESYFIMMNIYGSVDDAKLTYKVYDASTGTIYPAVGISDEAAGTFKSDKAVGSFGTPLVFTPLNEIEQDLSKGNAGWMWFSLFAQPKQNTIGGVFSHVGNSLVAISSRGASSIFNGNTWQGSLTSFDFDKMYKLNAAQAYTESLIGEPVDPTSVNITLNSGWNWIGYPAQASNSLNNAFAGAEPQEGDIVKSQSAFSLYTGGEWVGTLAAMVPGVGYMYNSTATDSKSFNFPKPSISGRKNMKASPIGILPLSAECNMTMVAVVMDGDELIEDAQVSVYAGTELNGRSEQAVCDGRHFLTIGGSHDTQLLTFVVTTADGREFTLADRAIFAADAQMGTLQQPCVLQLSDDATNIQFAANGAAVRKALLFDGSGRLVRSSEKVCTKAELERMPAGVYYQQVVYDNGMIHVEKFIR